MRLRKLKLKKKLRAIKANFLIKFKAFNKKFRRGVQGIIRRFAKFSHLWQESKTRAISLLLMVFFGFCLILLGVSCICFPLPQSKKNIISKKENLVKAVEVYWKTCNKDGGEDDKTIDELLGEKWREDISEEKTVEYKKKITSLKI